MRRLILILALSSCTTPRTVNKELKTLQTWIKEDYEYGDIPYENANNYYIILESIMYDLSKKKNDK